MALTGRSWVAFLLSLVVCLGLLKGADGLMNVTDQQTILQVHNNLRRNEGASNMQVLVRNAFNWVTEYYLLYTHRVRVQF